MNYTTTTLQYGSCTIIVHRPIQTEAERAKAEQVVKSTIATVMRKRMERGANR